eukprot:TRINITY_DN7327_c0_g2_i1.p1 TRINITY_DN7327_c0_g2~~TRINITY_DN7327_c0_g2_i1.p1  ORF type:complete len:414 (-),score=117.30 TRINITY_DN7327_c0_g2_i1:267-1508(-)
MSWFVRSVGSQFQAPKAEKAAAANPTEKPKGVKEDLSQLTDVFKRQLRVAANFIAPPPATEDIQRRQENGNLEKDEKDDKQKVADERNAEVYQLPERVRAGISKISSALQSTDVTGRLTKFTSKILSPDFEDAVGVTEEVLSFAANVSQHPGTWLNFPLQVIEQEGEDFDMSDAQQEHALAVESLIPSLSALRFELCPYYMNEGQFWKIYFVLIHSLLSKDDALLLSTPQIMEARALLSKESQSRSKTEPYIMNEAKSKSVLEKQVDNVGKPSASTMPEEERESSNFAFIDTADQIFANETKSNITIITPLDSTNQGSGEEAGSANQKSMGETDNKNEKSRQEINTESVMSGPSIPLTGKHEDKKLQADPEKEEEEEEEDWLKEGSSQQEFTQQPSKFSHEDDISFSDLEADD